MYLLNKNPCNVKSWQKSFGDNLKCRQMPKIFKFAMNSIKSSAKKWILFQTKNLYRLGKIAFIQCFFKIAGISWSILNIELILHFLIFVASSLKLSNWSKFIGSSVLKLSLILLKCCKISLLSLIFLIFDSFAI